MDKRINIIYFSGTGGTERAAKCFESEFKQAGYDVNLLRIKDAFEYLDCENSTLLLLYSVYALNAPQKVHEWVESLPSVRNVRSAVVSVSGGGEISPNTACRASVIKKLEKKGFSVTYENMIIMPSNFGVTAGKPISPLLLAILPKKVETIAADIDSGIIRRTKPRFFDRLMSGVGKLERLGAHSFGKNIHVGDTCTGCGWCSNHCPAGNITMQSDRPIFGGSCNFCIGCIYGCPSKALEAGTGKFLVFKDGFDLNVLEKTQPADLKDVEKLANGYAWKGVREYLLDSD